MPHRLLVFLLSLILLASLASAANLEERVVEHRLANGLTLLLMERHQAPIVAVNLTYKVGGAYEHNGFRLSDAPSGYTRTSPTLGQDNAAVLGGILGLSDAEQEQLADEGALD